MGIYPLKQKLKNSRKLQSSLKKDANTKFKLTLKFNMKLFLDLSILTKFSVRDFVLQKKKKCWEVLVLKKITTLLLSQNKDGILQQKVLLLVVLTAKSINLLMMINKLTCNTSTPSKSRKIGSKLIRKFFSVNHSLGTFCLVQNDSINHISTIKK